MPGGSDVVTTVSCVRIAFTVMLSGADAVAGGDCESATCTVKFDVPAVVGVPVIAPVLAFKCKPSGNVPLVRLQV